LAGVIELITGKKAKICVEEEKSKVLKIEDN
jgi:hypothetical protein